MTFYQATHPRIRRRSWPIGEYARPLVNSNGVFWERLYKVNGCSVTEYFHDPITVPGDDWERLSDGGSDV